MRIQGCSDPLTRQLLQNRDYIHWLTKGRRILWLDFGPKRLAPFALVITLYDNVVLIRSLDLYGQFRGFLSCRERFPIKGRVGPADMVVDC